MKPDPAKYRIVSPRALLGAASAWVAITLGLLGALYLYVERYRVELMDPFAAPETPDLFPLQLTVYANAAIFLLPALWLFWYASRAMHSGAFPPPGSWALPDQQVHLGSRAKIRALGVLAVGACCLAIAAAWVMLAFTLAGVAQA
jgi:hypothetical protein